MRNSRFWETNITGEALRSIAALLPASWSVGEARMDASRDTPPASTVLLTSPGGGRVAYAVVTARSGSVPVQQLVGDLRRRAAASPQPVLFVSDYIGPSLRDALADSGISYADATGWVHLASDEPLVLLTGRGAGRAPGAPRGAGVTRLNGVATSRIIRALAVVGPPVGIRELAEVADVSPGAVSKLMATLTTEGVIDRDDRGGVAAVRCRALIRRWARDYGFARSNRAVGHYIAPRGIVRTLDRLDAVDRRVCLTGSLAARRMLPDGVTPVVPLRLLALYTDAPAPLSRELGLIEADPMTANVVLAIPQDEQILEPTDAGRPPLASVALVLADLLTLPGRSDAEAEQLMDVLARDAGSWNE